MDRVPDAKGKAKRSDVDPIIMGAIVVVALSAIVFSVINIGSYYVSFSKPTLTLLNSSGLAQDYPYQIWNATPITFTLEVIKPQTNSAHYSILAYLSNGTHYAAEQNGPIGERISVIPLPSQAGNVSTQVNFTLFYRVTGSQIAVYTISLNGVNTPVNLTLPYRVVGLFFQLTLGDGGKTLPYAWVSLWLNVEAPS
ncbi:MAG: hypothetical protein QW453_00230 [Thermoprotei archaeon]